MIVSYENKDILITPGSFLLCSGNGGLSNVIKTFNRFQGYSKEASQITHRADIVLSPFMATAGQILVYESTTKNEWCNKTGVQLNPFMDWLDNYDGKVWICHYMLDYNAFAVEKSELHIIDNLSKPYESGIGGALELLNAVRMDKEQREDFSGIHCSELGVSLNKATGDVKHEVSANTISPAEHWPGGKFYRCLTVDGVFGEPVQIK